MAPNSIYSIAILWLLGHSIPCPVMTMLSIATPLMSLFEVRIYFMELNIFRYQSSWQSAHGHVVLKSRQYQHILILSDLVRTCSWWFWSGIGTCGHAFLWSQEYSQNVTIPM